MMSLLPGGPQVLSSMQASVEHVFPVRFGLDEFVSLVSELVIARSKVSTASGEGRAQLHGLVRISETYFVHAGAVVVSQAHEGVLGDGEVIKLLNFEIFPCVLIYRGSVEEAAGHISVVGLAQFEQVPLGLADLSVMSFASGEVALVLEFLEAGYVGRGGIVVALKSLDARDAPVVVVVAVVTPVTSVTSVTTVMMTVVVAVVSVVSSVVSPVVSSVVQGIFVVLCGCGFRRRG